MAKKPKVVDALSPLDAIMTMFTILLFTFLGFIALVAIASVFDDQQRPEAGANPICRTPNFGFGGTEEGIPADIARSVGLARGVVTQSSGIEVCQENPSTMQTVLNNVSEGPTALVFIGFLVLTRQTIKYARRHGLFSHNLAMRIERLGWLLLIGLIGAATIEWLADGLLKHSMVSTMSWRSGSFSISIAGIIGAYGIISIGRVMSRAATMHSDLEGTV